MDRQFIETSVKWTGDRRAVLAADGLPSLEVATPPEFPAVHPGIWSPEHLYTAAAEACLMTTFLAIAANSKLTSSRTSPRRRERWTRPSQGFS